MDYATWRTNEMALRFLVQQPGFHRHWEEWASYHDPDFSKLVGEYIERFGKEPSN